VAFQHSYIWTKTLSEVRAMMKRRLCLWGIKHKMTGLFFSSLPKPHCLHTHKNTKQTIITTDKKENDPTFRQTPKDLAASALRVWLPAFALAAAAAAAARLCRCALLL
jgi:hypothetical protein